MCVVALLLMSVLATSRRAQAFRITGAHLQPDAIAVDVEPDSAHYYLLLTGTNVAFVTLPVDLCLGEGGGPLLHSVAPPILDGPRFYTIQRVSLDVPLDSDADGIDDGAELTYAFLDPLNASDAGEDFDADGVDNGTEHLQGRDLTVGAVPDTNGTLALLIQTPLEPW